MPECEEDLELKDFVERGKALCNPRHLPESLRPPKKVAGLYWLKGLPLPDVAACFSISAYGDLGTSCAERVQLRHWRVEPGHLDLETHGLEGRN